MKNARALNVLALIFNVIIVGLVAAGIGVTQPDALVNGFVMYAVDSALLLALVSLLCIPVNISFAIKERKFPRCLFVLKMIAVASVMVSLFASVIIAVANGADVVAALGGFSFTSASFYLVFLLPIVALISVIFFDASDKAPFPVVFLAMIPFALYGGFYILNYNLKLVAEGADWYGIIATGALAYGLLAAFIGFALVIAIIIWLINRSLSKAYYKAEMVRSTNGPIKNVVVFDDIKIEKDEEAEEEEEESLEEQPVEEKQEEQLSEEPEEEQIEDVPTEVQAQEEQEPEEEKVEEEKPEPKQKKKPVKKAPTKKPVEEVKPEEEQKEEVPAEEEPSKEETKPEEKKPAPKKKPQSKKKEESKPASKEQNGTKVYHLTKRKEDGMWAITFVGGQKAVKLFKTKKEAEEYLATLTKNQGATALIRNSKGAKAGKFASSIKSEDK
ncbi:MAG: DUF2188 domain-containing protein [Bacilli bacterium]|nr:DUF2188 domain-containing protein [Bacilli bacterium]